MCLYVFFVCLFFCLFVLVFLLFCLPISAFKNRAIVLMLDSCLLLFFFKRQEIHMNIYIKCIFYCQKVFHQICLDVRLW